MATWEAAVREEYARAVSVWKSVPGVVSSSIRFWELGLSLDERVVQQGARALAAAIQSGASAPPLESCLLLLFLLRSRLTNVAGNYLWPEVAKVLTELSGREVDVNRCATWFRATLDQAFPGPLKTAKIHNRFVVHAFDEAGVGRDRSRIITGFFERLVEQRFRLAGDANIDSLVDEEIRRLLARSEQRRDVEALRAILDRSGKLFLRLVTNAKTEDRAWEYSVWPWERLRRHWIDQSGIDVDRLLPEGRQILTQLIPRLGTSVSRFQLAQMLASSELMITFPKCVGTTVEATADPRKYPLTPFQVEAAGVSKSMSVCDEFGLLSDAIMSRLPSSWFRVGSTGIFCWRREPFLVTSRPGRTESSVPLVVGDSLEKAHVAGYFWSGQLEGHVPVSDGVRWSEAFRPVLQIEVQWRVDERGLEFVVRDFRLSLADYTGAAQLMADKVVLWSGQLEAGSPVSGTFGNLPKWQHSSSDIQLQLVDQLGRAIASNTLGNPSKSGVFLTVQGRIWPGRYEYWVRKGESSDFPKGLYLFRRTGLPAATAENATLTSVDPGENWSGWQVDRIDLPGILGDLSRVHVAGASWELATGDLLDVATNTSACLKLGCAVVQGSGGAIPILSSGSMGLIINGWHGPQRAQSIQLELRSDQGRWQWPLASVARMGGVVETSGATAELELRRVADLMGVSLPLGRVTVSLSGRLANQGRTVEFVRLSESCVSSPCRIGGRAKLILNADHAHPLVVESHRPLRFSDLKERKRASGRVSLDDDCRLNVDWIPPIEDALLIADGTPISSPVDVTQLKKNPVLSLISTRDTTFGISLASLRFETTGASEWLLTEMLSQSDCAETLTDSLIVSTQDGLRVEWSIDLRPRDIKCTSAWDVDEAEIINSRLRAALTWTGVPCQKIEVQLCSADCGCLGERQIDAVDGFAPRERSSFVDWPVLASAWSDLRSRELTVIFKTAGVQVASFTIPPPPETNAGQKPDLKRAIKNLLKLHPGSSTEGDTILEALFAYCELYAGETTALPFQVDGLIGAVRKIGSLEVREQVEVGLRMLDAISRKEWTIAVRPDFSGRPHLDLLNLALEGVLEKGRAEVGLASLTRLESIADRLALFPGRTSNALMQAWARVLAAYFGSIAAEMNVGQRPSQRAWSGEDLQLVLTNRLLNIDPAISAWIANHRTTHD